MSQSASLLRHPPLGRRAKYCDRCVCMPVCTSVRSRLSHISTPRVETSVDFQSTCYLGPSLTHDHHCLLFSTLCFVTSHLSLLNSLDYIFTFLSLSHHCKAPNSLICADVPLRNYSLTHPSLTTVQYGMYFRFCG